MDTCTSGPSTCTTNELPAITDEDACCLVGQAASCRVTSTEYPSQDSDTISWQGDWGDSTDDVQHPCSQPYGCLNQTYGNQAYGYCGVAVHNAYDIYADENGVCC